MSRSRLALAVLALFLPIATAALVSSCGARSELYIDEPEEDAGVDAPPDLPPDVPEDVPVGLPPCDPELLYIYLVTSETDLYRYRPDTTDFDLVGNLGCAQSATPFSMGVSRTGSAYVLYNDGQLYKVSLADASCEPTAWAPGQEGFNGFGMGYAIDDDLMGETLYVAEINFGEPSAGLATIDTNAFVLDYIGPFSENPGFAIELTSSDDGNLYGYFLSSADTGGGFVVQIDKDTAEILSSVELPVGGGGSALAFAYWGGDFYIFTNDAGEFSNVTKYSPADGTVSVVATLDRTVVGAGVTTCTIP